MSTTMQPGLAPAAGQTKPPRAAPTGHRNWVKIVMVVVVAALLATLAAIGLAHTTQSAPVTPSQTLLIQQGGAAGAVPQSLAGNVPSTTSFYSARFGAF
jgi:NhaP-type Na+/H+ or K+/H+ antiporter